MDATVKTTTGVYNAIGSLGTFATVLAGIIIAYIKFGPKWKEISQTTHSADLERLTDRQNKLETKLDEAVKSLEEAREKTRSVERKADERVHKVELQLSSALNACQVLLNYVEREHSDAPEVNLARNLIAAAMKDGPDDIGMEFVRMVQNMGRDK